jgi:dihydropteroate synthase
MTAASAASAVGAEAGTAGERMLRRIGIRDFDFSRQVAVMAVINRTPDSFYDTGATFALDRAVASALRAGDQGADWVDIGGVPFGRGPVVTTAEEIDRVVPVVAAITAARPELVISVDTNNADVAAAAIDAGAAVINDTSGLADPRMADVVARSQAHVVITHSVGPPRAEKPAAHYDDVVGEVRSFLVERMARAEAAGVPHERLIIDPGHDLDKNTLHTLEITRRLDELASIDAPLLVAVSNKDFIGESIDRPQGERLPGSLAAMTACILKGARIVRMHDIPQTVDAVRMTEAILGWRQPVRLEHNTHPTHNV